jgi:mannan endo-1,4-beta-mannosidase
MGSMPFRWVRRAAGGRLAGTGLARLAGAGLAVLVGLAGCAGGSDSHATRTWSGPTAASLRYIGVIASGVPDSYAPVAQFRAATGARINLAGYYSGWGERFQSAFVTTAWQHGTETMVDVDPPHGETAMQAIANGQDDAYITQFAEAVRGFGHPVIINLGHEMNGNWSGFGYGSVRPTTFVAVYRHVYELFRRAGASNATWAWAINIEQGGVTPPGPFFPGDGYVDLIGIDGYDWSGTLTFQQRFGPTLAEVRQLSARPVFISETSVLPTRNAARQVTSWITGIAADHLLGLVWFDVNKTDSTAKLDKHDWRLQDDPAALAAFHRAFSPAG